MALLARELMVQVILLQSCPLCTRLTAHAANERVNVAPQKMTLQNAPQQASSIDAGNSKTLCYAATACNRCNVPASGVVKAGGIS